MSAQRYQVGAHLEALNDGILVAPLKTPENFFFSQVLLPDNVPFITSKHPLHVSLSSFLLVGLPTDPGLIVGCDSNDDCPDYTSCRNRKCINPCAVDKPCAPSALCKVVNHNPVCTCPNGYIGSPHTRCTPRKSPNNKVEMILYCQVYESKT